MRLGVGAVALLLLRPSPDVADLARRLGASVAATRRALRHPAIMALVTQAPNGALAAARGATSATLPRQERQALAVAHGRVNVRARPS
jgi:hypothetical protein